MRILLVTDGSPEAEAALAVGALIACRVDVSTTILAILDPDPSTEGAKARASHPPSIPASEQAQSILARAIELMGVPGVNTQVQFGDAFNQIIQEASAGAYDLVILGDSQPHHLLKRFRRSSIAVKVAENAPCSVLIVRGSVSAISRILLCDSGAGMSTMLSRLVLQLAEFLEGDEDVTILHVMSQISAAPGVPGAQLRAGASELIAEHSPEGEILEQDLRMLEKPGIHPTPKVRHGLVVDEILAEAHSGDYDLVVVGAHPATRQARFMLENIAHQVITNIARPVLVVRSKSKG